MPAPSAPTGLAVAEKAVLHLVKGKVSNKAAIAFSFTNVATTAQHRLQKSVNSGASWTDAGTAPAGLNAVVATGLALNTAHQFRLRAENGEASAWTAPLAVTTPALATVSSPPALPGSFACPSTTSYSANLTWSDDSDNEAYFEVELTLGGTVREVYLPGLVNGSTINVQDVFRGVAVAGQIFSARIRTLGGKAPASKLPAFASAWTDPILFKLAPPAMRITSPRTASGEKGALFSYTITTNQPATSWTSEDFPSGLVLGGDGFPDNVIHGTPTVSGTFLTNIEATDGITTDSFYLPLKIVESRVQFRNAATATAPLGKSFSLTLQAVPAGEVTFTADNLPAWLQLITVGTVTKLSGTPDDAGIYEVQVIGASGPSSASQTIVITVPPVALLTARELRGALGQDYKVTIAASPSGCLFTGEDLPEWLSITPEGVLSGTPPAQGTYTFDLTAGLDDEGDSATFTLTVGPLFEVADVIEGAVGRQVLEYVRFAGAGVVTTWFLSGEPPGIEHTLWNLVPADGEAYYGVLTGDSQTRGLRGIPTQGGAYRTTISVNVIIGGGYKTYSKDVIFRITGGLYVNWFHSDPSLYDLQVSMRGDAATRRVESFYGVASRSASTSSQTVNGVTTTTQNPASEGNLLTLKRGDTSPRIGILIRDDLRFLVDEVSEVRLTIREVDAEDGDYLFDLAAVSVELDPNRYFLASFEVIGETLDDAMSDDSLTQLSALGEISWQYGGALFSSPTFNITITEDIRR
jgi:hypothetical protein